MIDYQNIIENLNLQNVINLLEKLGVEIVKETEDYYIFKTLCHNIDENEASEKLYLYKNSKLFVCYTHCGNMSVFKFLKNYYEIRDIEYDWYEDIYNPIVNCSNIRQSFEFVKTEYKSQRNRYRKNKRIELPIYSDKVLDCFIKTYPAEWLDDGITRTAMDKFNILYSISQNKIIIPHYDVNGNLIGIRGRALEQWEIENLGKYMPVKIGQTWYKHPLSLNLYGLYQNKNNIKRNGICYLFEGEKSVLQMESFSIDNCAVAICGSNFNKFALKLLIEECAPKEIVICFDKEENGNSDTYFNKLYSICKKYSNYANFSFIYDRQNLLDMKDSPTDKGEEIFKKLLDRRTKVK